MHSEAFAAIFPISPRDHIFVCSPPLCPAHSDVPQWTDKYPFISTHRGHSSAIRTRGFSLTPLANKESFGALPIWFSSRRPNPSSTPDPAPCVRPVCYGIWPADLSEGIRRHNPSKCCRVKSEVSGGSISPSSLLTEFIRAEI